MKRITITIEEGLYDKLPKYGKSGAINVILKHHYQQEGREKLWEYIKRFGFGSRTGVAMPGESAGMLRYWEKWHPAAIGSIAMGHEIITTTVQLARAASVVANGGMLVKPRLILNEGVEKLEEPKRIIKPETAITMRRMMEHVVLT